MLVGVSERKGLRLSPNGSNRRKEMCLLDVPVSPMMCSPLAVGKYGLTMYRAARLDADALHCASRLQLQHHGRGQMRALPRCSTN